MIITFNCVDEDPPRRRATLGVVVVAESGRFRLATTVVIYLAILTTSELSFSASVSLCPMSAWYTITLIPQSP